MSMVRKLKKYEADKLLAMTKRRIEEASGIFKVIEPKPESFTTSGPLIDMYRFDDNSSHYYNPAIVPNEFLPKLAK